ncbi:MAG: cytochrome P450, partial [Nocardioidaceae bacterium]
GGHGELPPRVRRLLDLVAEPGALGPLSPPSMLAVDPPEHTQYRRRVSRVFTPRAVAGLEAQVQRAADDLLDPVAESGARGFDLVSAYAAKLPIAVIAGILGVPTSMHERVLEWGDSAAVMLDPGLSWKQYRTSTRDLRELYAWFDDHVAYLRRHPGDDLLSRLAQLDGADRLTDLELRATGLLVLGAGFETTVNLISNAVALLHEHPDQLAIVRDDPQRWPNAVEEVLRLDSPVQLTLRQAYSDTEVDGAQVEAGQGVLVMLAGANRDPAVFEDPSRFDVRRSNAADHLAFSSGVHYCLGASLARMEATIALRTLYDRFPDLAVTGSPIRRPTRVLRGYDSLLVSV